MADVPGTVQAFRPIRSTVTAARGSSWTAFQDCSIAPSGLDSPALLLENVRETTRPNRLEPVVEQHNTESIVDRDHPRLEEAVVAVKKTDCIDTHSGVAD